MMRGNKKYAFEKSEILSSYPMTDIVALAFIFSSLPHSIACILLLINLSPEYLCYYLSKFLFGKRHHAKPITRTRPEEMKSRTKLSSFVSDFLILISFNAIILLIIECKLSTKWFVYLSILSNSVVASELIGHSQPSSLLDPDTQESKGDAELQSNTISVVPLIKKEQSKHNKSVQQNYPDPIKSRRYIIAKRNIVNALICFCAVIYIDYLLGKVRNVVEYIQPRYFARHIADSASVFVKPLVEFLMNFRWKPRFPSGFFFDGIHQGIRGTCASIPRISGSCLFVQRKYSQSLTYSINSICGVLYFPLLARAIMNGLSFLRRIIEHLHNLLSIHIITCEITSLFTKKNVKTASNPLLGYSYFTNSNQHIRNNRQNFHTQGNNLLQYHNSNFRNRKSGNRVLNVSYSFEQEGSFYARSSLNPILLDVVIHNIITYFKSQFCEEREIYKPKINFSQSSQGIGNSRNLMSNPTREQELPFETAASIEEPTITTMRLAEPIWAISAIVKIIINNTKLFGQLGVETRKGSVYPKSKPNVKFSTLFIGDDRVILRLADKNRKQEFKRGSHVEVYVNAVKWIYVESYTDERNSQPCLCIYGLCPLLQYSIEVYQFVKSSWVLMSQYIINTVSSSDQFSSESHLCTTLKTLQSSINRSLSIANDRKHMIKKIKKDHGRKMAEAHKEVEMLRNRIDKYTQNNRNSNRKKGFEHSLLRLEGEIDDLSISADNIFSSKQSTEIYYEIESKRQEEQIEYLQNFIAKHENTVSDSRRQLQTTERRKIQSESKNSKLSAKLRNTINDIESAKAEIEHLKKGFFLSKLQKIDMKLEERTFMVLSKIDTSVKQLDNLTSRYQFTYHRRGGI